MKILVERWDCYGDVLCATSVLPGLREKFPDSHIVFATRRGYDVMLENNPYIDEIVFESGTKHVDKHIELGHDQYFNGFGEIITSIAEAHCMIADVPFHPPELYLTNEELSKAERYKDRVVVAESCGWTSRAYPGMSHFVKLLQQDGILPIQLDRNNNLYCEWNKISLREAAAIMSVSSIYVGVDTVFMHMAVALKKPMVLAMGATGIENQYIPNATVVRQFPWTSVGDTRYSKGIDVSPEKMMAAFYTRYNGMNFQQIDGVSYTDGDGNEIVEW